VRRLSEDAFVDSAEAKRRRDALEERLRRLRDLYELGDLTKSEYVARRGTIHLRPERQRDGVVLVEDLVRRLGQIRRWIVRVTAEQCVTKTTSMPKIPSSTSDSG
jgi:hypothetical protein